VGSSESTDADPAAGADTLGIDAACGSSSAAEEAGLSR